MSRGANLKSGEVSMGVREPKTRSCATDGIMVYSDMYVGVSDIIKMAENAQSDQRFDILQGLLK